MRSNIFRESATCDQTIHQFVAVIPSGLFSRTNNDNGWLLFVTLGCRKRNRFRADCQKQGTNSDATQLTEGERLRSSVGQGVEADPPPG